MLMWLGRWIGRLLIALALLALGGDLRIWIDGGAFDLIPLGALWGKISLPSQNLVQAVLERYIHPYLWNPILLEILQWPAVYDFAVPGIVFAFLFRRRRPRPY